VLRIALGVAAVSLVFLAACGNGEEATPTAPGPATSQNDATAVRVTPAARPETVPETARPVGQTTTLGRIVRRANEPAQAIAVRGLLDAGCEDDTLVMETSQETIYATLPCTRFWDAESAAAFLNQPVAVQLEVTQARLRILVETVEGAQAEFTVSGIWVE
jgi:hypothetical protein